MNDLPTWARELPLELIEEVANKHHVNPCLIAAICQVESSGLPWSTRFEPGYKWTFDCIKFAQRVGTTEDTEEIHQMTSWGLMQLMGGTARWIGYRGPMPELCKPEVNLEWGCRYLERLLRTPNSFEEAVSCYNAGSVRYVDGELSNQPYVDKVMKLFDELEMQKVMPEPTPLAT